METKGPTRQLAAIMFTDLVGYTALMGKDSVKALELVRISKEIQKPLVEKHNGKWLKEMGDGAMAQFSTALDAVNCSLEIQEIARGKLDAKLRIGIHLGDVTVEENDVHGDGVNVASRLESIADPGGIYISESIEKAIKGQSEVQAKYLGEIKLKNVSYGVRTYALQGVGLPVPEVKEEKQLSGHLMAELQRRGVLRAGLVYIVLSLLLILLVPYAKSWVDLPEWTNPVLIASLLIGFTMAIYLAWTFERSPEGFVRTSSQQSWQNPYKVSQRKPLTGNTIIIGLLLVIAIVLVYPHLSSHDENSTADGIINDKSIVVLPFVDMSPNHDQDWFSDGLTEELLNHLSRLPELKLISRTSAYSFKGKGLTGKKIADSLGVSFFLEGSVRKAQNQIRVTAQLIKAKDDSHVWSEDYNYLMDSIFAIQEDISVNIARALNILLDEVERDKLFSSGTRNIEAYEEYLKGSALVDQVHGSTRNFGLLKQANIHFDNAIAADPEFARPYAIRYDLYWHQFMDEVETDSLQTITDQEINQIIVDNFDAAIRYAITSEEIIEYQFDKFYLSGDWDKIVPLLEKIKKQHIPLPGWADAVLNVTDPEFLFNYMSELIKKDSLNGYARIRASQALISMGQINDAEKLWKYKSGNFRCEIVFKKVNNQSDLEILSKDNQLPETYQTMAKLLSGQYDRSLEELYAYIHSLDSFAGKGGTIGAIQFYNALGEYDKADSIAGIVDAKSNGKFHLMSEIFFHGLYFHLHATPNFSANLRRLGIYPEEFERSRYLQFPVVKLTK